MGAAASEEKNKALQGIQFTFPEPNYLCNRKATPRKKSRFMEMQLFTVAYIYFTHLMKIDKKTLYNLVGSPVIKMNI